MATLKHRIRRKNSAGSYDVVHFETESGLVVRPNNETVETTLTKTLRMKNAEDTVPGFHTKIDADTLQGKTAAELVAGYAKSTELESVKTSVSEGKKLIAAAVTDKGVETAADATFKTMSDNIGSISTVTDLEQSILANISYTDTFKSDSYQHYTEAGKYENQVMRMTSSDSSTSYACTLQYNGGNKNDVAASWYNPSLYVSYDVYYKHSVVNGKLKLSFFGSDPNGNRKELPISILKLGEYTNQNGYVRYGCLINIPAGTGTYSWTSVSCWVYLPDNVSVTASSSYKYTLDPKKDFIIDIT